MQIGEKCMSKRRWILGLLVVLCLVLVSCGKDKKDDKKDDVKTEQSGDEQKTEVKEPEPADPLEQQEPEKTEPEYDLVTTPKPYEDSGMPLEAMETTARVNVRVGGSLEAAVYDKFNEGTEVQRIRDEGEWSVISHDGYELYIASAYLQAVAEEPEAATEPKEYAGDTEGLEKVVTTAKINVRVQPSTSAPIHTKLPEGSEIERIRDVDGWSAIYLNGYELYVSSDYLKSADEVEEEPTEEPEEQPEEEPAEEPKEPANDVQGASGTGIVTEGTNGYVIVIDAGHQSRANTEQEANGPGSSEMKNKVSGGTTGVSTGTPEYKLTLQVSMKLKAELVARGYTVVMVRETHDVNISNSERAKIANKADADAFIRIHANGSTNPNTNGMMTICQTPDNPYNSDTYQQSRILSQLVLDEATAATGAQKQYVWETDTMTGINWAEVPSTILEMGYMTNAEEDEKMAGEEYQNQIADAVADAVDRYLGR